MVKDAWRKASSADLCFHVFLGLLQRCQKQLLNHLKALKNILTYSLGTVQSNTHVQYYICHDTYCLFPMNGCFPSWSSHFLWTSCDLLMISCILKLNHIISIAGLLPLLLLQCPCQLLYNIYIVGHYSI